MTMQIGIIGSGSVGSALHHSLSEAGHDVVIGSREPEGDQVTIEEAAQREVVILAVPYAAALRIVSEHDFPGIVIDPTNPIGQGLTHAAEPSGAQNIAQRCNAPVVKCFNSVGAEVMRDAKDRPFMPVAGEEKPARTAMRLAKDVGFEPVYVGDLSAAASLEHLALLWIRISRERGRDFSLRI